MAHTASSSKVSVLMPAYNAEKYIKEAIISVLDQTYKNFELIIVNDGSTDGTKECILAIKDERIVYKENDINRGLSYTRNRLIKEASGDYYAWLDADDVFHSEILEKQVAVFSSQPKSHIVAAWARVIDGGGNTTGQYFKSYATPVQLPVVFLFVNYIVQSSVMARKAIFQEFSFKEDFPVILDYEIWTRIADTYSIIILKEVLVDYRIHSTNMSIVDGGIAKQAILKFYKERFTRFAIDSSNTHAELQYDIAFGNKTADIMKLDEIEKWMLQLVDNNNLKVAFGEKVLVDVFAHRWTKACLRDTQIGYKALVVCASSKLFQLSIRNTALLAQYTVKLLSGK